jgi:MFS family permease
LSTAPTPLASTSGLGLLARIRLTIRALRHRNFRLFLSGQFLSLIGTWIQTVAQAWLVYRLSGSSVMLGLVGFATQAPYLLAPLGGVLADRMNRRKLLILTQSLSAVQALILAALTLSGMVQVWHVFCLALLLGFIGLFDITARQSFVVEMVGKQDLMNAIALNSTAFNLGRIMGPSVAGILLAAVGEGWCFLINSCSFITVIAGLLMIRIPVPAPRERAVSLFGQFRQGIRYVRHSAPLRALLVNLGIVSVMNYPVIVLMPIFADRILSGGPRTLGILMSSFGVGALIGAVYMATRTQLRGLSRTIVRATVIYSVALVGFSFAPNIPLACLFLIIVGFGIMLQVASTNTALQTISEDNFRGRVMGFYGMMFLGLAPIGSLLAGWLGDFIGARYTVTFGAVVCIFAAALFNRQRVPVVAALRQIMEGSARMVPAPVNPPVDSPVDAPGSTSTP